MNSLFDLLLDKPISEWLINLLMFLVFVLHFIFVLFTIGTAILAFYLFMESLVRGRIRDLRWDKYMLKTFMAHKSLTVVLGVGALLLIQVGFTIPFFTGITLFGPEWILIIPLLIISFIAFDSLAHKIRVHHITHLIFGFIALISLLAVPAIFVTILVTAENSTEWANIANNAHNLTAGLSVHWLFRYLHVLGAGIVFGATFHFFFGKKEEWKRQKLLRWIIAGILFQIIIGVLLYGYLPHRPDATTNVVLIAGILAAMVYLWIIFSRMQTEKTLRWGTLLTMLLLILLPMLLTRQLLQNRSFIPLNRELQVMAASYQQKVDTFRNQSLATYDQALATPYNNGQTIFAQSCAFCHGNDGDGNGSDAVDLTVQPEAIAFIRTNKSTLYSVLIDGVNGTGMPYFSYYDKYKIDNLIEYLDKKFNILKAADRMEQKLSQAATDEAKKIYNNTCSVCHGHDGRGTSLSRGFEPAPPDFTTYTLQATYAYKIISDGYPGTMMQPYPDIPGNVKWGLVQHIKNLYHKKGDKNE